MSFCVAKLGKGLAGRTVDAEVRKVFGMFICIQRVNDKSTTKATRQVGFAHLCNDRGFD